MKRTAIFVAALVLLAALPAGLDAQQAGFRVGIGTRIGVAQAPYGIGGPIFVGPNMVGRTLPGIGGSVVVGNRGRFAQPPAYGLQRGRGIRPRPGINRRGSFVFVGPPAVKIGPGHQPFTPTHPVATPGVTVITPGGNIVSTGTRPRGGVNLRPGTRIVQQGIGPAIAVRTNDPYSGIRNVGRGTPRHEVITRFGRPKVQILNRDSETLIFGGTTVIIQNGVVALVR